MGNNSFCWPDALFLQFSALISRFFFSISSFSLMISFRFSVASKEWSIGQPLLFPEISTQAPFNLPFMRSNSPLVLGSITTCPRCTPFVPTVYEGVAKCKVMPFSPSNFPNQGPRLKPTGTSPTFSMMTSIPHSLNFDAAHSAAFS